MSNPFICCALATAAAAWSGLPASRCAAQAPCLHQKLTASDGSHDDQFGLGLALRGPLAAIGAFGAKSQGPFTGEVRIFERQGTAWDETARLTAPGAAQGDCFGYSIAMSNSLLVVGAPSLFPSEAPGRVHLFSRVAGEWVHMQRLNGSQAGRGARFGQSVGVQGTRIVIGSPEDLNPADTGKVYVFELSANDPDEGWSEAAVLRASDGAGSDRFGAAVAVSADRILVGAPRHGGGNAGAAYMFRRTPDGQWVEEAKFTGPSGSQAGSAVALSDGLAVIGRPGGAQSSAAIYRLVGGVWTPEQSVSSGGQSFGWAVACAGDTVIIGGRSDPEYPGASAARVYQRQAGAWSHTNALSVESPPVPDLFSRTLALNGNVVLVGANRDGTDHQNLPGAAYVFGLNGCSYCPADFDMNGTVDPLDVQAFLVAFTGGDPVADTNADGVLSSLDVLAFLSAWSAGCE